MRIRIIPEPSVGEVVHGRCTTVSEGGFGAILTQELPPQNEIWVEFRGASVPENARLRAEVRQRRGFQYGFQFVSPNAQEKSLIRQLVAQGVGPR
jgi:hypothetical protein